MNFLCTLFPNRPIAAWPMCFFLMMGALLFHCDSGAAQSTDSIFLHNRAGGKTKLSGQITDMNPEGITIKTRGGTKTIAASEVRKVVYGGQSLALDRTRERIMAGNYEQGLEEIEKIDAKGKPLVEHELSFLAAWSQANLALTGAKPLKEAGTAVNRFLKQYPRSYHFYPMTELKGRLLEGLNLTDLAAAEYVNMTRSTWQQYALKGRYRLAGALNATGSHDEAIEQCDRILNLSDNSDMTRQYQRLAACARAKSQALAGDGDGVEETLKQIIKIENPDNKQLFAAAYNAWGVYHFKAGRWKEAREKFLMTHLLMTTEIDSHAEALYYLSQIWPKFENTDEANKSRQLLQSRYRNSYWAKKLN